MAVDKFPMPLILFNVYDDKPIQKIKENFNRQKIGVTVEEKLKQIRR